MRNLLNNVQWFLCDIDFYNEDTNQGDSFVPFLGFVCFLAGLVLAFVGFVKISNAKKQWNIFYDDRDRKDLEDPKYDKEKKIGIGLVIAGIALMILSFVFCP